MMLSIPFRIVGFDLDGTLVDTSPDLAAAVDAALAAGGFPPLRADIRPMIGGGSRMMLRHGLAAAGVDDDEALVNRLLPVLLQHYHDHIADGSRPFPGAMDALDALAGQDVRVAIVTNKLEGLANRLLDTLGLGERFATVIGGDTMGIGKPDPAPIRAMIERCGGGAAAFVGDSIFDVEAARAAVVPSVAVSFGFLDRPVEALGATCVIDHYDDLLPALATLGQVPGSCAA